MQQYYAHKSDDGRLQPLADHLKETAELAGLFAAAFKSREHGWLIGFLHDSGKASLGFTRRLLHQGNKVDHSTLGAQFLSEAGMRALSFTVAGHHTGLADYGADTSPDEGVLARRLQKQVERTPAAESLMKGMKTLPDPPLEISPGSVTFSLAFWLRMLFSCLTDADWLDTERFMSSGQIKRGDFSTLQQMHVQLAEYLKRFDQPKTPVHRIRNGILDACLNTACYSPGLFSLTVPTGGGKTLASLAFALSHILSHQETHDFRRIIYCLPYTSILEQNGKVFEGIVGKRNVLMHYADAMFREGAESDEDDLDEKRLATENWDHPFILTTNVQFLESLFHNKPSKCRKLHNIANSIIILDEAQMLPRDYLTPSVWALEELCRNYGCTVLLMSATQPALTRFLRNKSAPREINPQINATFDALRRVKISHLGEKSLENIADYINKAPQALCIVNTKKRAKRLFDLIQGEGCFHLSTLMLPDDRLKSLKQIRHRLKEGLPCRVISTSLVEAGVDLDFPVGFREETGLDSIIQAAGRVNREGNHNSNDSYLYVFQAAGERVQDSVLQMARITQLVFSQYQDVTSPEAIHFYFEQLFHVREPFLDKKGILDMLDDDYGYAIPFARIAKDYKLIENDNRYIFIPVNHQAACIASALQQGESSRDLLRKAGQFIVQVWPNEYESLEMAEVLSTLPGNDRMSILERLEQYNPSTGLLIPENTKGGKALFDS